MGSLMAGWNSPKSVMRNKSLTNEEIEGYWSLKKQTETEHLTSMSPKAVQRLIIEESAPNDDLTRTNSLPILGTKNGEVKFHKKSDAELEHLRDCWWTRSSWAFLNEPPVIKGEVPKYKYAAQYHVANLS